MTRCRLLLWLVPLGLTSTDALAWGLTTHVFYAQLLLWAVPLADARYARAARRFPALLLTGACLPDLSLVARAECAALAHTHRWPALRRLLDSARDDAERALAMGYASHLLADIVAHNHFVPAHEHVWGDVPLLTHACCEWALDAHVANAVALAPARLLGEHAGAAAAFLGRAFATEAPAVAAAIARLRRWERLLRASRLPHAIGAVAARTDPLLARRFGHYLRHTGRRMAQIDRLLAGATPALDAETCRHAARAALAEVPQHLLRARLPLPHDLFAPQPA